MSQLLDLQKGSSSTIEDEYKITSRQVSRFVFHWPGQRTEHFQRT